VTAVLSGPKGLPRGPAGREATATLAGVNGKLLTLYRLSEVDAPPTAVQRTEAAKAERELAALATSWDALVAAELTPLNAALTAAGLAAVRPELVPETRQSSGDEE